MEENTHLPGKYSIPILLINQKVNYTVLLGNPGINKIAQPVDINPSDINKIIEFVKTEDIFTSGYRS